MEKVVGGADKAEVESSSEQGEADNEARFDRSSGDGLFSAKTTAETG